MPDTTRTPSTDEVDYQRRLDEGFKADTLSTTGEPTEVYAPFAVEGNDTSAYVGVSPEYMTYASETEAPSRATEGVEGQREARALDAPPVVAAAPTTALDEDTSTQGSGASSDLVYTAASGEGFTAQKAVAPEPEVKTEDATPEAETIVKPEVKTEAPTAETVTPAPAATAPAADQTVDGPKAKSGSGKTPVPPPAS
jgi:hypothetical protein